MTAVNPNRQKILTVGNKRQLTIPEEALTQVGIGVGGQLFLEVRDDCVILHPAVSVPRQALPEELRRKFESRRGVKSSDVPVNEFLADLRKAAKPKARPAATPKPSAKLAKAMAQSRLQNQTHNQATASGD